jgi:hypothetical protein
MGGSPDHEGALRLSDIWRRFRRQDVFPSAGARAADPRI